MRYVCPLCGEVYDEAVSGTPFADLPEEWRCPLCFAPKNSFRPQEDETPPAGDDLSLGEQKLTSP